MRRLGMSVASVTFSSRQAAIWRHWPTRQHRRDRAVHPHDENALHARHSRPCATRDAARGTQSICQLVQRPPSAHDAQGGHSGRDLPRPTSDLSLPAIRAATELASEVTVRSARCPDPRPVWPAVRTERRVRSRSDAPAECHALEVPAVAAESDFRDLQAGPPQGPVADLPGRLGAARGACQQGGCPGDRPLTDVRKKLAACRFPGHCSRPLLDCAPALCWITCGY